MSNKIALNLTVCHISYKYLCRLQGYTLNLQLFQCDFDNVTKALILVV